MVHWLDRKYGPDSDFEDLPEECRPKPSFEEVLEVVLEGSTKKINFPEQRLDTMQELLWRDIGDLHKKEEFSRALNCSVVAKMYFLATAGRRVPKEHMKMYKRALERHNLDPDLGYRL